MTIRDAAGAVGVARGPDLTDATARRRLLLDIVRRRVRPGSGSAVDFLRTRTWSEPTVDLHRIRTPFVLVGATATALYMPERQSEDVDILILASDAAELHRELTEAGCTLEGRLTIGGSSWQTPGGRLDVIEADAPWAADAVGTPNRSPTGLPVISLPYLVLMKLHASRTIDLGDVTRMLGLADEAAREQIREVVRAYYPEALEDVESMIDLGELELRTSERREDE